MKNKGHKKINLEKLTIAKMNTIRMQNINGGSSVPTSNGCVAPVDRTNSMIVCEGRHLR